ncbi:MAG: pyridoxamine 5'-phosphate oxidase [Opitutales bacterium]|nr:pyridoxamine 5'-phosphate oxidase [Opitutales bacterium]
MTDISTQLQSMREQYDQEPLRRSSLHMCPFSQFATWLNDAVSLKVYDPNACSLSTVDDQNGPVARAVLLKGIENGRFIFYTNQNSRKAKHLTSNPKACIHFPWFSLQRQVLVTGEVSKVEDSQAEEYFRSRPLLSQLGAWASSQSEELDSRETLEKSFLEAKEKYGEHPPKPPHWGGYYLLPNSIEFWQGGPNRLHDRFLYENLQGDWCIRRLNP